ncbi:hypothetical protein [Photorhabdus bodei]|uniref:Uncharacterized protein n=2 Tax=Photorhabdus TaxID=29487 RepID=A0A329X2Y9_9GAMM|nr:hypothetical protein [Photorhabdus bodei]NDK99729.1 hypothetical protein [Photorhabdus bodei]NDL04813.1 hypothetical protein [Photorhabdus bodei]NDL08450.1 hypothetical protein [Photorhabdus bodei]RAX11279.1 hypothetical protein CKY02_13935 [Photorhabdus bodei]
MSINKDMIEIARLISLLKQVVTYLKESGNGESSYAYLIKSINILENKASNGMKNLYKYIMNDFRMMGDRGQYGEDIDPITDEIYAIISNNPLFTK